MSDKQDYLSHANTCAAHLSLCPGENKPNFAVRGVVGMAYPWPGFGGQVE